MRKPQAILTLSALLFSLAALPGISAQHTFAKFTAANISSATDIPFPPNSIAVGVVTLSLGLDASGKIQNIEVQRDVPSLTSVVQEIGRAHV